MSKRGAVRVAHLALGSDPPTRKNGSEQNGELLTEQQTAAPTTRRRRTLGRLDAQRLEAILVRQGQHDSFDQLFNLLVEATHVIIHAVRRLLVDFHRLDTRVVPEM